MRDWWNAEWREQASCLGTPTDMFYPDRDGNLAIKLVHQVCDACPVQSECLADSKDLSEGFGIWGGQSAEAREAAATVQRRAAV